MGSEDSFDVMAVSSMSVAGDENNKVKGSSVFGE